MKKLIIFVASIVIMVACLFTAWLFFMGSGIIDEDVWRLNEWRSVQIMQGLDGIPLIKLDVEKIIFTSYGTLAKREGPNLLVLSGKGEESFNYNKDLLDIEEGDLVKVYYRYSYDGKIPVLEIRKISPENNFINCNSYANENCPKRCAICPPCPECSSISCNEKEFCERLGFDEFWQERLRLA